MTKVKKIKKIPFFTFLIILTNVMKYKLHKFCITIIYSYKRGNLFVAIHSSSHNLFTYSDQILQSYSLKPCGTINAPQFGRITGRVQKQRILKFQRRPQGKVRVGSLYYIYMKINKYKYARNLL